MDKPIKILEESQAEPESFHDCHAHGLGWKRDDFVFFIDMRYITEWLEPSENSDGAYRFRIADARLLFRNVSDLQVSMDWSGAALDSQIDTIRVLKSQTTPNGKIERLFEIAFSDPDGSISLWSTDYQVMLLSNPQVSSTPS